MKIAELDHELICQAQQASKKSYSPYSNFRVGAAIVCDDGSIFQGTNIENRSYGLTICAERNAVFSAVVAGHRNCSAIAVYSPDSAYPLPPCGACRQVLSEFAGPECRVIMVAAGGANPANQSSDKIVIKALGELLPFDSLHDLRQ